MFFADVCANHWQGNKENKKYREKSPKQIHFSLLVNKESSQQFVLAVHGRRGRRNRPARKMLGDRELPEKVAISRRWVHAVLGAFAFCTVYSFLLMPAIKANLFYFSRLPSSKSFIISLIRFTRVSSRLALSIHLTKFFL